MPFNLNKDNQAWNLQFLPMKKNEEKANEFRIFFLNSQKPSKWILKLIESTINKLKKEENYLDREKFKFLIEFNEKFVDWLKKWLF